VVSDPQSMGGWLMAARGCDVDVAKAAPDNVKKSRCQRAMQETTARAAKLGPPPSGRSRARLAPGGVGARPSWA
jgi:hypothetical protein